MAADCPLADFRTSIDDSEDENKREAHRLKHWLSELRSQRRPFVLSASEFDVIMRWKLRGQYARQSWNLEQNSPDSVRTVTGRALNFVDKNKETELRTRFAILRELSGVGVPVASAVLTLVFPDEYAVIDFRGWRQVFGKPKDGKKKKSFTVTEYRQYLEVLRRCAEALHWPIQEVDLAIWKRDELGDERAPTLVSCQCTCPLDGRRRLRSTARRSN